MEGTNRDAAQASATWCRRVAAGTGIHTVQVQWTLVDSQGDNPDALGRVDDSALHLEITD